jgi:DnaA family protein
VVLDDVHLYSTAQQAMAFNWFVNAISPASGAPRWVLAAGNLPPADLPLRDDLRSRLGWGHVFQLQCCPKPSAAPCCARRPTPGAFFWATR